MVMLHSNTNPRTAGGSPPLRVVIAAGGTGGHIYPGLAVAAAVERLAPGTVVTFSGTPDRLEARLVPAAGYRLDTTPMRPVPRRLTGSALGFPARFVRCVLRARRQLRQRRADVVIGVGGYPSVPAVVAAWTLRLPVLVHESNATPGLANVLAARLAGRVATAFDPTDGAFARCADVRRVGIPISSALASCDRAAMRDAARRAFGIEPHERFVVVSGGSLGAVSIDRVVIELGATCWQDRPVRVLLKASGTHAEDVRRRLRERSADRVVSVVSHIEDMASAYAAADVVVTRAGACTVAEVEHLGVPAVMVPFPGATDDHQTANARALAASGAPVVVLPDDQLDARALDAAVSELAARSEAEPGLPSGRPRPYLGPATATPHAAAADAVASWAIELARSTATTTTNGRTA